MEYKPTCFDRLIMVMENCKKNAIEYNERCVYGHYCNDTEYYLEIVGNEDGTIDVDYLYFSEPTHMAIRMYNVLIPETLDDSEWVYIKTQNRDSNLSIPKDVLEKLV